jgi:hypothetical protein
MNKPPSSCFAWLRRGFCLSKGTHCQSQQSGRLSHWKDKKPIYISTYKQMHLSISQNTNPEKYPVYSMKAQLTGRAQKISPSQPLLFI